MVNEGNPIICKTCGEDSGIVDGIYMDATKNCDENGNLLCSSCGEIVFLGTNAIMENIELRVQDELRRYNDRNIL